METNSLFSASSLVNSLLLMNMSFSRLKEANLYSVLENAGFDFNTRGLGISGKLDAGMNFAMWNAKVCDNGSLRFLSEVPNIDFSLTEDRKGRFSLIYAVANWNVEGVDIILSHPTSKINQVNLNGSSALICLGRHVNEISWKKTEIMEKAEKILESLLKTPNIDLDIQNVSRVSALMYFKACPHQGFYNRMIQAGANKDLLGPFGQNELDIMQLKY